MERSNLWYVIPLIIVSRVSPKLTNRLSEPAESQGGVPARTSEGETTVPRKTRIDTSQKNLWWLRSHWWQPQQLKVKITVKHTSETEELLIVDTPCVSLSSLSYLNRFPSCSPRFHPAFQPAFVIPLSVNPIPPYNFLPSPLCGTRFFIPFPSGSIHTTHPLFENSGTPTNLDDSLPQVIFFVCFFFFSFLRYHSPIGYTQAGI